MTYQLHDHVLIKDGILLHDGKTATKDFGGYFVEIKEDGSYSISLDKKALTILDDDYILQSIQRVPQVEIYKLSLKASDLQKSLEKDTYVRARYFEEFNKFQKRVDAVEWKHFIEPEMAKQQDWIEEFSRSPAFLLLSEKEKLLVPEYLDKWFDLFREFRISFRLLFTNLLHHIILNKLEAAFPNISDRITAEAYGHILIFFLKHLDDKKYLAFGDELIDYATTAVNLIPIAIMDTEFAKATASTVLEMANKGLLNASKEEQMQFIENGIMQQLKKSKIAQKATFLNTEGLRPGDRITVKYIANGQVKQDVKYKKVQKDLEDGKCVLLRR
jgi:hypothetical protein